MTQFHSEESMSDRFGRKVSCLDPLSTHRSAARSMSKDMSTITVQHWYEDSMPIAISTSPERWTTSISIGMVGRSDWLDQIETPIHFVGIRSDWLYPPQPILQTG